MFVKRTSRPEMLPALVRMIAPLPALNADTPVPVMIAPVCVNSPLLVTVKPPASKAVMLTPDSDSRPAVRMAILLQPLLVRLTAPRKLLPGLLRSMLPRPAMMVTAPVPVLIAPVCLKSPLLVTVKPPASKAVMLTPDSDSRPALRMAILFAPVLFRFTAPLKLLPALFSVIAPAPALMVTAPVFELIDPVCVNAPLLVMVSVVPQLMDDMVMPLNASAFTSRIDTFCPWPRLFRLTAPRKSLLALSRMIAPLAALLASKVTLPVPVRMAPVCRIEPCVFTVRLPAKLSMVTPESVSAPMSRMAMLLAPVLRRFTAPRKSLPPLFSVIAPAPALMAVTPATVMAALMAAPVCVMLPFERSVSPFTDVTPESARLSTVVSEMLGTAGATGCGTTGFPEFWRWNTVFQPVPVFVKFTAPRKMLLALFRVMAPASA